MNKQFQKGIILGMIFLSGQAFAQVNERPRKLKDEEVTRTYFDVLLNVVSTNFNYGKANSSLSNYKKPVLGLQAGVSFQAGITPKFSLVTELYFVMKGSQLNGTNPLTSSKSILRFYTMELPVLARFHMGRFYLNAGPSLTYNLYGTRKTEGSTSAVSFNSSDEGFKRIDAGVQVGAGYRFKIRQRSIVLDVRYTNGFTNISNSQEMYNRYLNISLRLSKPWKTNPLERRNRNQ